MEERFKKVDKIAEYNQLKVIGAMQKNKVAEAHFNTTTGYGYNDLGRETLEKVYADVFHTEDALVRPQITCGTHALALALSANLRPNDKLVYISGKPYDTLEEVIGIRPSNGSLAEYGVKYDQVDLLENGEFDFEGIKEKITNDVKVVGIQRSKGYATRPTLSVEKISQAIKAVKEINPNIIVMVDNCYGEFVEEIEPSDVGADMIVGSLIKNPGGGLALLVDIFVEQNSVFKIVHIDLQHRDLERSWSKPRCNEFILSGTFPCTKCSCISFEGCNICCKLI